VVTELSAGLMFECLAWRAEKRIASPGPGSGG